MHIIRETHRKAPINYNKPHDSHSDNDITVRQYYIFLRKKKKKLIHIIFIFKKQKLPPPSQTESKLKEERVRLNFLFIYSLD